ncbi:MAG: hypothetical protein ACREQ5_01010 [Candidatus Dormibacteria bacterium]
MSDRDPDEQVHYRAANGHRMQVSRSDYDAEITWCARHSDECSCDDPETLPDW